MALGATNLRKLLRVSQTISELKPHDHPYRAINTSVRSASYLKPNALNTEKIVLDCSYVHRKPAVKGEMRKVQCLRLKRKRNPILQVKRVGWANNV